jgi:hypothetical protein
MVVTIIKTIVLIVLIVIDVINEINVLSSVISGLAYWDVHIPEGEVGVRGGFDV